MEYVKNPVVIHAEQWYPNIIMEGVESEVVCQTDVCSVRYFINTLEGKMSVHEGDWVITGVEGEKYCCKDSIFRKTYHPVENKIDEK